jgi:hypothetical protein
MSRPQCQERIARPTNGVPLRPVVSCPFAATKRVVGGIVELWTLDVCPRHAEPYEHRLQVDPSREGIAFGLIEVKPL